MSTISPTAAATTNYDCYDRLLPKLRAYYCFGAMHLHCMVSISSVCRHNTMHTKFADHLCYMGKNAEAGLSPQAGCHSCQSGAWLILCLTSYHFLKTIPECIPKNATHLAWPHCEPAARSTAALPSSAFGCTSKPMAWDKGRHAVAVGEASRLQGTTPRQLQASLPLLVPLTILLALHLRPVRLL